jgi:hypothetical protein
MIPLTIVVNGQQTIVNAQPEAPLHTVIPKALEQTGNAGQGIENWELRDSAGTILDLDKKIEDFRFPPHTVLFLNLKAGVGGSEVALQVVDPQVSMAKFNREIDEFRGLGDVYRRRGWFLAEADFPHVLVVLGAQQLSPPAIVVGVSLDFTNYDAEPPSVHLVNPFTGAAFRARELPTTLNQAIAPIPLPGMPPGAQISLSPAQPLMQASSGDEVPFLCIPGVREYHEHPGHTGDAWELHRATGAGRLARILEVIDKYGVQPITGFSVSLTPQVGLQFGPPPQ